MLDAYKPLKLFVLMLVFSWSNAWSFTHSEGIKAIGLDRAVKEYVTWSGFKKPINALSVEDLEDSHGKAVAHLYQHSGESPEYIIEQNIHGIGLGNLTDLPENKRKKLKEKFIKYVDDNNVKLVLSSSSILIRKGEKDLLKDLKKRKVIVSNSAGNSGLSFQYKSPTHKPNEYIFLAGALADNGLNSAFSSEGKFVTAVIPENTNCAINPINMEKDCQSYTSGAQPVMAKILYLLLSVLPESHYSQLNLIFKETAIKSSNSLDPLKNKGYGTFNAYLALKVSMKIVEQKIKVDEVDNQIKGLIESIQEENSKLKNEELKALSLLPYNDSNLSSQIFKNIHKFKPPELLSQKDILSETCTDMMNCNGELLRWSIRQLSTDKLSLLTHKAFEKIEQDITSFSPYRQHHVLELLINEKYLRGLIVTSDVLRMFEESSLKIKFYLLDIYRVHESLPESFQQDFFESQMGKIDRSSPDELILDLAEKYFYNYLNKDLVFKNEKNLEKLLVDKNIGFIHFFICDRDNNFNQLQLNFIESTEQQCVKLN